MTGVKVAYSADGVEMIGRLYEPQGGGRRPGLLVAHESPGITGHTIAISERLAARGYVVLTVDYQGGGQVVTDRDEMMRRFQRFMSDPAFIRARMGAALAALLTSERVDPTRLGALGYCYGGTAVLELARGGADLKAVAGFHCGLTTARPQDATAIKGKVLVAIGADDPVVPADQRVAFEQEMTAAGVDWRLALYGRTSHSFTNPEADGWGMPGFAYSASADQRSWRALIDLLDETMGAP